jgi:hypothetical protein
MSNLASVERGSMKGQLLESADRLSKGRDEPLLVGEATRFSVKMTDAAFGAACWFTAAAPAKKQTRTIAPSQAKRAGRRINLSARSEAVATIAQRKAMAIAYNIQAAIISHPF